MAVRFAPDDFAAVEAVSAGAGLSVSAFVRQSVMRVRVVSEGMAGGGILGEDERLLFGVLLDEVRRVGINVNQIAMRLNAGGAVCHLS